MHGTQIGDDRARLFYRFRPKRAVREAIATRARAPNTLTLADYAWELAGGGNPAIGLHQIEWNTENDAATWPPSIALRMADFPQPVALAAKRETSCMRMIDATVVAGAFWSVRVLRVDCKGRTRLVAD